jgi:hypothetical protein
MAWNELIWHMIGTGGDCCEYDNEPSGSMKFEEFVN